MFFGTNGVTSSCLVESKARERKVHHLDRSTSGCERCRWDAVAFVAVSCDGTGNDGALAWVVIVVGSYRSYVGGACWEAAGTWTGLWDVAEGA